MLVQSCTQGDGLDCIGHTCQRSKQTRRRSHSWKIKHHLVSRSRQASNPYPVPCAIPETSSPKVHTRAPMLLQACWACEKLLDGKHLPFNVDAPHTSVRATRGLSGNPISLQERLETVTWGASSSAQHRTANVSLDASNAAQEMAPPGSGTTTRPGFPSEVEHGEPDTLLAKSKLHPTQVWSVSNTRCCSKLKSLPVLAECMVISFTVHNRAPVKAQMASACAGVPVWQRSLDTNRSPVALNAR